MMAEKKQTLSEIPDPFPDPFNDEKVKQVFAGVISGLNKKQIAELSQSKSDPKRADNFFALVAGNDKFEAKLARLLHVWYVTRQWVENSSIDLPILGGITIGELADKNHYRGRAQGFLGALGQLLEQTSEDYICAVITKLPAFAVQLTVHAMETAKKGGSTAAFREILQKVQGFYEMLADEYLPENTSTEFTGALTSAEMKKRAAAVFRGAILQQGITEEEDKEERFASQDWSVSGYTNEQIAEYIADFKERPAAGLSDPIEQERIRTEYVHCVCLPETTVELQAMSAEAVKICKQYDIPVFDMALAVYAKSVEGVHANSLVGKDFRHHLTEDRLLLEMALGLSMTVVLLQYSVTGQLDFTQKLSVKGAGLKAAGNMPDRAKATKRLFELVDGPRSKLQFSPKEAEHFGMLLDDPFHIALNLEQDVFRKQDLRFLSNLSELEVRTPLVGMNWYHAARNLEILRSARGR